MQYYLIQKVQWLFNSFLTKMFNRRTNVALAGNMEICEVSRWDSVKGKTIRVKIADGLVFAIGGSCFQNGNN